MKIYRNTISVWGKTINISDKKHSFHVRSLARAAKTLRTAS